MKYALIALLSAVAVGLSSCQSHPVHHRHHGPKMHHKSHSGIKKHKSKHKHHRHHAKRAHRPVTVTASK